MDNNKLAELIPLTELRRQLENIFPSDGSLQWELRQHRAQYIGAGAIFKMGHRYMAHPETFKRVALEIAGRRAATHAGVEPAK